MRPLMLAASDRSRTASRERPRASGGAEASRAGGRWKRIGFYELIEAYFPNLPKIELNARGAARPGWQAWGLEAAPAEAAE